MCGCKSNIGKMARKKKGNAAAVIMQAGVGVLGVIAARTVGGFVGGGTVASAVKVVGGVGIATTMKGANAAAFGTGMALDGMYDFVGPTIQSTIASVLPSGTSTLRLSGITNSQSVTAGSGYRVAG